MNVRCLGNMSRKLYVSILCHNDGSYIFPLNTCTRPLYSLELFSEIKRNTWTLGSGPLHVTVLEIQARPNIV